MDSDPGTPVSAGDRDTLDLARFGYQQELKRSLSFFSSFAVAFSYISPSTGIFTLYVLGLSTAGGFFFWTWPLVAAGQFLVALNFAEVSSHFPLAGSVFQWSKYLSSRPQAWFTGWIYLFAGILTVTAVDVTLPLALIPLLQNLGINIPNNLTSQIVIAVITLVSTTLLNIFGVRLVAIINNTGVTFEILGMVVFALILALLHSHQGLGIVFNTGGTSGYPGTFFQAMFMSLFVIYGFDTASTLAEETHNPRLEAPRAVLASIGGAFVIGTIFLLCTLVAIPNLAAEMAKGAPPADIITANLPGWAGNLYLLVVSAAIYVCCLSIQTSTIRLMFGMARDDQLPISRAWRSVHPALHTPIGACLGIGVLAAVPLLYYAGAGIVAIAATGMIYLSYFLGNLAILRARLSGWPKVDAPFKLGAWAMPINLLALFWGGSMLINFLWPRPCCNPGLTAFAPGLTGFLGSLPIFESTVAVILIVGAIYWFAVQSRKETPVVAPAEGTA